MPAWEKLIPVDRLPVDWPIPPDRREELNLLATAAGAADALAETNPARAELVEVTYRALESAVLDLSTEYKVSLKRL